MYQILAFLTKFELFFRHLYHLVLWGKMIYNKKESDKTEVSWLSDQFEKKVQETIDRLSRSKEVEHIKVDLQNMAHDIKKEFEGYQSFSQKSSSYSYSYSRQKTQEKSSYTPQEQNFPVEKKYAPVSVPGILCTVFGGIGAGTCLWLLIFAVSVAALLDLYTRYFFLLAGLLSSLLVLFGWMTGKGISLLRRTSRLKKYLKAIGKGQFCPIDLLVEAVDKDKDFVVKDLQKMIRKNMLPDAHIDDEKTCLILNEEVYDQYRYVKKQAQQRQEQEEAAKRQREEERRREDDILEKNPELAAVIKQGREMLAQIRKENDLIEGEEVSEKIFRLERVVEQIFLQVQQYPQNLPDLRRMMNYYLPITLKLLDTYEQFDHQSIQSENIKQTKVQIEQTLDTINEAFENLYNNLFSDKVIDINSDISVLETMLKQEGLTGPQK